MNNKKSLGLKIIIPLVVIAISILSGKIIFDKTYGSMLGNYNPDYITLEKSIEKKNNNETFYLYFISPSCSKCINVDDYLPRLNQNKLKKLNLYLINIDLEDELQLDFNESWLKDIKSYFPQYDNYINETVIGAPMMFQVLNGKIVALQLGEFDNTNFKTWEDNFWKFIANK